MGKRSPDAKPSKRKRSASIQEDEGDDPRARLAAFRARMFDLKPVEPSTTSTSGRSSYGGDTMPTVQWKASKKSKKVKHKALRIEEDADAVPQLKLARSISDGSKKSEKKAEKKSKKSTPAPTNVVRVPGAAEGLTARFGGVQAPSAGGSFGRSKATAPVAVVKPSKTKLGTKVPQSTGIAASAVSDPPTFDDSVDALELAMQSVHEKMKKPEKKDKKVKKSKRAAPANENVTTSKTVKKAAKHEDAEQSRTAAKMNLHGNDTDSGHKSKKAKKTKKIKTAVSQEVDEQSTADVGLSTGDMSKTLTTETNSLGVNNGGGPPTKANTASAVDDELAVTTLLKTVQDTSTVNQPPQPSINAVGNPTERDESNTTLPKPQALSKGQKKRMKRKKNALRLQNNLAHVQQPATAKAKQGAVPDAPPVKTDSKTTSTAAHDEPSSAVQAHRSPQPNIKPQQSTKPVPKSPVKPVKKSEAVPKSPVKPVKKPETPKSPVKPVKKSAAVPKTATKPSIPNRAKPLAATTPKHTARIVDSSTSDSSDDESAAESERASDSTDDSASDSEMSDSSESDLNGPQQRRLFSNLITEAARDQWELNEVGRLVRLFAAQGWDKDTKHTARFLRHHCPELVSADFLDGLDVTLSTKQLLSIFDRGSGTPGVFVNKVAFAVENKHLRVRDPAVADALGAQLRSLADSSSHGVVAFLMPLFESLSTVRDVGVLLANLCRHWQPERTVALVQQVLLTNVFDDLDGEQDEILRELPQLEGQLDFPNRMHHEDADENGNLIGFVASDDDVEAAGYDDDASDPESDEDDDDEEFDDESDSEEERGLGRKRRSRGSNPFILEEAEEDDEDMEDEEEGWEQVESDSEL